MFGGGAKKEKKDDDEDRGDNSGSAKAQRDAASAAKGGEVRDFGEEAWMQLSWTEQALLGLCWEFCDLHVRVCV